MKPSRHSNTPHKIGLRVFGGEALHFALKMPNKTTAKTIKDVQTKQNLTKASNLEDLFKKLGI